MSAQRREEQAVGYTYDDYARWDLKPEERMELIDGEVYMMASPSWEHQDAQANLIGLFWQYLKGKDCKVFAAPLDIRLEHDKGDKTVVQPDIVIICDKNKLTKPAIKGVPDLIVEILSPSSRSYDTVRKFNKYLQAGVKEYWILDPEANSLQVFVLKNGEYTVKTYGTDDKVKVSIFDDLEIELNDIFIPEETSEEEQGDI